MWKRILCTLTAVLCLAAAPLAVQGDEMPQGISSMSAVLMEPETGKVLYAKDAHTPRPMASTTKLMTALLALENAAPDQNVVVTREAVMVEGSSLGLREGDNISMLDLVTGLLLESGNDAANVIALTVSGSLPAFADRMNRKAAQLGMKDTVFVTPSGLDKDNHSSSAYDMALLGAEVMRNPTLAAIVAKKSAVIEMGNPKRKVTVTNHNRLLSLYPYATGMKTGYTKKSGKCLVSSAVKDGVTLVAATLNGGDYWNDHIKLYNYGFTQVQRVQLEPPPLPDVAVAGGQTGKVQVQTEQPPAVTLLKGEEETLSVRVELAPFVWAPVEQGQRLGYVRYSAGERELCRLPIQAAYAVEARPVAAYPEQAKRWFGKLLRAFLS